MDNLLEAISKLAQCNKDANERERKLGTYESLLSYQQLVFGSFAARQKSVQPAIDACKATICHHPHLSFTGCLYAADRSIQYSVSTTFRQADHRRTLYSL